MSKYSFISPRIGAIISADIAVHNFEKVKQFYIKVLCTGKKPLWEKDLMSNCGVPIIGLGPHNSEYGNLPVQWMPHIQVQNVTDSVDKALEQGGQLLLNAKGDNGDYLWAVILDPNGAAFGLIPIVSKEQFQPYSDQVSTYPDMPLGHISRVNLMTSDAVASRRFYQKVIGWKIKASDTQNDDHKRAAVSIDLLTNHDKDLPSVWLLHLPVGDYNQSLLNVVAEGGKVIKEVAIEDKCVYSIIQDPDGAYMALFQS